MKQFGQGLHRKQLQGMKSHSFTQSSCTPKEQSQPPGALTVCTLSLGSAPASSINRDELEQLTDPAQNNPPSPHSSLQASFSVRSVSTCGCNVLVGAFGSGRVLPQLCSWG